MKMREYEIRIGPNGDVEIHMEGFQGRACLEALHHFEQWIGEAREVRPSSSFYVPEDEVSIQEQQRH